MTEELEPTGNSERNKGIANLKPWKPGQSGNPSGRPKKKLLDEVLTELLELSESADAREIAKALIAKAKSGNDQAAKLIAERTQGKPMQKVEVTGADGGPIDSSLTVKFVGNGE